MKNNEEYWDMIGGNYGNNWKNFAKDTLSKKETKYILNYFLNAKHNNVLDIGPGNGRIINKYLEVGNKKISILGLDISDNMVSFCRKKFDKNLNVKIEKCDLSSEDIPYEKKFDFISAIRVLKYNENWRDIIKKISQRLEEDGIFIFTMINNNSTDRFALYPIKVYKTNQEEIRAVLNDSGLKFIETTSFTKIPDIFYNMMGKIKILSNLILGIEKILEVFFGKLFFGRILFIVAKK